MSVLLAPQSGSASTTVFVFCRVGSRYERKEINGASHFIEHLMFKGTTRRPSAQILSRELDRYGATYNAYTGKSLTAYYIKIAGERADEAVDLLNDMVFHSLYKAGEIDRERGVIVEEINMCEDNPVMHIDSVLEAALFPNSSLGWDIAGPRSVIKKIDRKDILAYRDAYYVPSRVTLVVAGRVPENVLTMLEKTFGTQKEPKTNRDTKFIPFTLPERLKAVFVETKNTEQTQTAVAFYGVPLHHADEPAIKLLSIILGGYMSSRLFVKIREELGLCYSVSASHEALEDTGVFSVYMGLDKKRLALAAKTLFSELDKARKTLISKEEFERAKEHIRGNIALAFEDSAFQAQWYGRQWLFTKNIQTPKDRLKEFDSVTREDVRRVAKEILRPDRMAVAIIGPHGQDLEKKFVWE